MIIFFGWGRKAKETVVGPESRLLMTYHYFHVFWLFSIAWGKQYQLATFTEHGWAVGAIAPEHAAQLAGGVAPEIHPWRRFSLLGALGLMVLLVAWGVSTS